MDFGNIDVILWGMMSSMKTGHVLGDILICLFLPVFFKHIFKYVQYISNRFLKFMSFETREYNRYITHVKINRGYNNRRDENQILQKAVRLYMGTQLKLKFKEGDIKLSAVQERQSSNRSEDQATQLKRFKANHMPSDDMFIELEPGLFFRNITNVEEEESKGDNSNKQSSTRIRYHFRCVDPKRGKERVDAFVQKAMDWYIDELDKQKDVARYMYQPLVAKNASEGGKNKVYKRYKLSDDKNFGGLFFPDKQRLLKLMDNFLHKKGKFAVPGFPYKLGLLLHGPPGTGKTSMVKAIAHYTRRHIISVPLSRIRTNQELMDVMFDQLFQYVGIEDGIKNKHKFSECIFLMEDVDAAGSVVHTREEEKTHELSTNMRQTSMMISQRYLDDDQQEQGNGDDKEKKKESSVPLVQVNSLPKRSAAKDPSSGAKTRAWWELPDKLDLAGLLNVLDGVVDCPGRILVMTTNHPEKIDPAVTRPGRINLQLYLGHMNAKNAQEMVEHYFGGNVSALMSRNLEKALEELFSRSPNFKVSPAEMEQMCAEHPTLEGLIDKIKALY